MNNSQLRRRAETEASAPVVLLVSNDPGAARLLSLAFSEFDGSERACVTTVWQRALCLLGNGDDAEGLDPAGVVLDIENLSVVGRDLLSEIRETASDDSLPVIIFARDDGPAVVDQYLDQGATTFLHKPGDYAGLEDVITDVNAIVETGFATERVTLGVK